MREQDGEIREQSFQIKMMQATTRQYSKKGLNMRRLIEAAVSREEYIFEFSNAKMERAAMEWKELELTSLNSDPEDKKNRIW